MSQSSDLQKKKSKGVFGTLRGVFKKDDSDSKSNTTTSADAESTAVNRRRLLTQLSPAERTAKRSTIGPTTGNQPLPQIETQFSRLVKGGPSGGGTSTVSLLQPLSSNSSQSISSDTSTKKGGKLTSEEKKERRKSLIAPIPKVAPDDISTNSLGSNSSIPSSSSNTNLSINNMSGSGGSSGGGLGGSGGATGSSIPTSNSSSYFDMSGSGSIDDTLSPSQKRKAMSKDTLTAKRKTALGFGWGKEEQDPAIKEREAKNKELSKQMKKEAKKTKRTR